MEHPKGPGHPAEKEEVKKALAEICPEEAPGTRPKASSRDKFWFVSYVILLIGTVLVYYLVRVQEISIPAGYRPMVLRLFRGGFSIVIVLLLARSVSLYLFGRIDDDVSRYNLRKVLNLIAGAFILLIVMSSLFVNWYGALVSLGVLSLILGIALQNPITSFFGWIFLLIRKPYRVGDRIKIGDKGGDVVDVGYFDTTLWEFRGDYLTTDHPSGRLIRFPNSLVFQEAVINYSWPLFPYIWNEINFQVSYGSDRSFIEEVMTRIVTEEIGEDMMERVREYRSVLAKTAIDEMEVREYPFTFFRADDATWIRATVRYLVEPRTAGRVKNKLTRRLLDELNKYPDKVGFPKGNMR